MSATLSVEDFMYGRKLFRNPPPVIEVPTRQFPVTIYFSSRTKEEDYIGQACKKALAIHKRLPRQGILVFVTGQREVDPLTIRKIDSTDFIGVRFGVLNLLVSNFPFPTPPEGAALDEAERCSKIRQALDSVNELYIPN
ncbi:hypothetical protein L3X38_003610 [Prunus dulcis]|uniref:RNA helicase n=1 Tax=Prunus dulcis TaxID=3755 RepID=A0AAD5F2B3_PRUDU|nr:hypothetical protein L3X38_003610 [Prunus dulcis]